MAKKKSKKKAPKKAPGSQPQPEPETAAETAAEAPLEFSAVDSFQGRRDGFEFKLGDRGLGYYRTDAAIVEAGARAIEQQGPASWIPQSAGLPTREEQAKWKPLEWERFKEERRQYWARLKHPMLRKSAAARGLYDGGDAAALRDRMLKSDLGMGLTELDKNGPAAAAGSQAVAADTVGDTAAGTATDNASESTTRREPYIPQPGEQCYAVGCQQACDVCKECPVCLKRGMRTFFCTNECFKQNWASHKKLHSVADVSHLEKIQSWGLARPMAAEIMMSTDVGSIAAVAAMANTDELVAIMALRKNDFDVGQAVMHLSGRDSEKRMDLPTQDEAMNRVLDRLK